MTSGHLWKTTHLVSKQKVMTLKRARERKLVGDLISNLECTTFFWWSKEVVSSTFLQIFFPLTMRKTELAIHSFSLWLCSSTISTFTFKAIVVLFQFLWFLNFEIPLNHLMVWVTLWPATCFEYEAKKLKFSWWICHLVKLSSESETFDLLASHLWIFLLPFQKWWINDSRIEHQWWTHKICVQNTIHLIHQKFHFQWPNETSKINYNFSLKQKSFVHSKIGLKLY